jgi:hypothetical protein
MSGSTRCCCSLHSTSQPAGVYVGCQLLPELLAPHLRAGCCSLRLSSSYPRRCSPRGAKSRSLPVLPLAPPHLSSAYLSRPPALCDCSGCRLQAPPLLPPPLLSRSPPLAGRLPDDDLCCSRPPFALKLLKEASLPCLPAGAIFRSRPMKCALLPNSADGSSWATDTVAPLVRRSGSTCTEEETRAKDSGR